MEDNSLDDPRQKKSNNDPVDIAPPIMPPDPTQLAFDFKQELAQCSELNARYEESNKMFICHLCDFRTAFRNSLLNHQAVHSDVRPWVCAMCDYAAKRKQDLKKHLHTIHGMMVESPMLRPIGAIPGATISIASKSHSRDESSEENSCDTGNEKINKTDSIPPMPCFPHHHSPTNSMTKLESVSVKQELQENMPIIFNQGALPSMSHFVQKNSRDSPDMDLPLSFPAIPISKYSSAMAQNEVTENVSNYSEGENSFTTERYRSNSKQNNHIRFMSERQTDWSTPSSTQKPSRKRPYTVHQEFNQALQETANGTERSAPPPKSKDTEDLHPCSSSSSNISHAREVQTHPHFLCEHCDIMFFQRAMYLMHIGLHSADDPWCCAVCGNVYNEKYSFTSHFINQH
ncbi:unnamed protein product [Lymnaea stagnalis]|uniref:C2H2-type domain-containing protein n=1 Tax=Lymnaea stagnalis TaxID=6523 RepID=A0AAV2HFD4_LYMST